MKRSGQKEKAARSPWKRGVNKQLVSILLRRQAALKWVGSNQALLLFSSFLGMGLFPLKAQWETPDRKHREQGYPNGQERRFWGSCLTCSPAKVFPFGSTCPSPHLPLGLTGARGSSSLQEGAGCLGQA